jgi:hypothetical protein
MDTVNVPSPSTNPVTQLGVKLDLFLFKVFIILIYIKIFFF